ncbi:MAG: DUF4912 domain-containing protein [Planctomycetales bacterium]|nr:DUF4912 domain-containing protein [Planctomycetales bacterium]
MLITTAELNARTKADLARMAKKLGIPAPSNIKKDELVSALAKASRKSSAKNSDASPAANRQSTGKRKRNDPAIKPSGPAKSASPGSTRGKTSRISTSLNGSGEKEKTGNGKAANAGARKSRSAVKPEAAKESRKSASSSGQPTSKSKPKTPAKPKKRVVKSASKSKASTTSPGVLKKIREFQLQKESNKDISFRPALVRPPGATEPIWEKEPQSDRVALFVRDAYWMHATWDITRLAIERAKAAMAEQWHGAKPILRLLKLDDNGTTSTSETVERDVEIHGGLRNWYLEWTGESARFRVLVGYLGGNDRFHAIAKSNIVRTPAASSNDAVDTHFADSSSESERIFSLSGGYDGELETVELKEILEDRLHRKLGAPELAKLGATVDGPFRRRREFHFDMDIELVVYGSTAPDGFLTLSGEPVALRPDGTFVVRLPFPDRRQVLPAVSCSRDGSQQRTIVVAVERNTKIMEPMESEQDIE